MNGKPLRVGGISWYAREDYAAVLNVMRDPEVLPDTYEQWLQKAERQLRDWEAKGWIMIRAIIDPKTFPEWCRARGLDVDAKARMAFANEIAAAEAREVLDKRH